MTHTTKTEAVENGADTTHNVEKRDEDDELVKVIECANEEEAGVVADAIAMVGGYYADIVEADEPVVMTDGGRVDSKELFKQVNEGDQIVWDERTEPLTVYRHVTEDDPGGQLATMKELDEDQARDVRWQAEHTSTTDNDEIEGGDLLTGELTGDEFLIVRGPRGGAYIIARWWDKGPTGWTASIVRYRRKRDGNPTSAWEWENVDLDVQVVGHEDVDRDAWADGLDWAVTDATDRTIWSDWLAGERSEYNQENDEGDREGVARALYENTDVGYSVTDDLLIVTAKGETELPGEVGDIATGHGWARDTDCLMDGEFDPYENSTAFVYTPVNG